MANFISEDKRRLAEALLVEGYSKRAVAKQVGIAVRTVEFISHAVGIFRATGFRGVGTHRGRNQCTEWVKHRTVPTLRSNGTNRVKEYTLMRAHLIEVRRVLYYRTHRQTHNANLP